MTAILLSGSAYAISSGIVRTPITNFFCLFSHFLFSSACYFVLWNWCWGIVTVSGFSLVNRPHWKRQNGVSQILTLSDPHPAKTGLNQLNLIFPQDQVEPANPFFFFQKSGWASPTDKSKRKKGKGRLNPIVTSFSPENGGKIGTTRIKANLAPFPHAENATFAHNSSWDWRANWVFWGGRVWRVSLARRGSTWLNWGKMFSCGFGPYGLWLTASGARRLRG